MILNDIKDKLQELDSHVFYGMVDKAMNETVWNYTVFNRLKLATGTNKTNRNVHYQVHIVRENFIPEGLEEEVIEKMLELPGFNLVGDGKYNYIQKPNTNVVVEMFSMEFVKAKKKA